MIDLHTCYRRELPWLRGGRFQPLEERQERTVQDTAPDKSSSIDVCVYCGSGPGRNPAYVDGARTLGRALAANGVGLVYGGGSIGLMGEVARATLEGGGRVTGIIPSFLRERELALKEASEMIVTTDMHERKRLMFERADAFVALPGGVGTLEELVEQLTWAQLGRHSKPIVIANINGFWSPFLNLLAHMREDLFIRPGLEVRYIVVDDAARIVPAAVAAVAAANGGKTADPTAMAKL